MCMLVEKKKKKNYGSPSEILTPHLNKCLLFIYLLTY